MACRSATLHVSKIVADDRTNSIIIVATERAYLRILEFIKRLDVPGTGEGEIHVLPLQHADADELSKTLSDSSPVRRARARVRRAQPPGRPRARRPSSKAA